jgi:hypothetical protein
MMAVSQAPIAAIQAYKRRMGWSFPWASSLGSDFNFDFNVSFTEEQQREGDVEYNYRSFDTKPVLEAGADSPVAEIAAMTGSDAATYTREAPGMSAFALYEGGVVVSNEGAWRADDRGNAPGIFMPADPQPGMTYQQEVAPGIAEDQATVVRRGKTVTVPAGTFADTITVRDYNPLDGNRGTKIYAPHVGLIVDGPLELIDY